MRFALLIYDENTANPSAEPPDPDTMAKVMDAYNAFTQGLRDAGAYAGGEALQPHPTATTIRVRDGQSIVTDGPFAETKEGLGGFYLVDCADIDAALEWAAKCPGAWFGTVEVRPIYDWSADYTPGEATSSAGA